MSAGRGGPQGPGMAVPDLGALRHAPEQEMQVTYTSEAPGVYVNDVQPSVGADGMVTLTCRLLSPAPDGGVLASDAVVLALPAELMLSIAGMAPQMAAAAAERMLQRGARLSEGLGAAQRAAAAAQTKGGPPANLADAMRERDGG